MTSAHGLSVLRSAALKVYPFGVVQLRMMTYRCKPTKIRRLTRHLPKKG